MQLLTSVYYEEYAWSINLHTTDMIENIVPKSDYAAADFEHYLQSAATYSSNIEGNTIDFDTFLKNKKFNISRSRKKCPKLKT